MNFQLRWSVEDQQWVGTCEEYPSLSYLDADSSRAQDGIVELAYVTRDDIAAGLDDIQAVRVAPPASPEAAS